MRASLQATLVLAISEKGELEAKLANAVRAELAATADAVAVQAAKEACEAEASRMRLEKE
tara:strand:- start:802 stop:981 length:180 start_codon:yes stop_codon:yes gene_type:complete